MNELTVRTEEVPSLSKEGTSPTCQFIHKGADGVVLIKQIHRLNEPPRPCQIRRLRDFFLMARRPLLIQGGDFAHLSIHSHLHRPRIPQ